MSTSSFGCLASPMGRGDLFGPFKTSHQYKSTCDNFKHRKPSHCMTSIQLSNTNLHKVICTSNKLSSIRNGFKFIKCCTSFCLSLALHLNKRSTTDFSNKSLLTMVTNLMFLQTSTSNEVQSLCV